MRVAGEGESDNVGCLSSGGGAGSCMHHKLCTRLEQGGDPRSQLVLFRFSKYLQVAYPAVWRRSDGHPLCVCLQTVPTDCST